MRSETVTNWGNFPTVEAQVSERADEISAVVAERKTLIARGNGRCYGDASLGENIFSTLKLNKFLAFDEKNQTLECEAGVLLSEILDLLVPKSLFLPVVPGTKFVTVGGAIAADIHGKNHHVEGSFTEHLISFKILTETGEILSCSLEENVELFRRTCGGMGLTGIILSAKLKLKKIETAFIRQISQTAANLEAVMRLFEQSQTATYSVAWIDCLARGKNLGRSILMTGEHAEREELPAVLRKNVLRVAPPGKMRVPFYFPAFSLNRASVKAFNFLYFYKQIPVRAEGFVHYDTFFFPLDGVRNWNRIYGRRGFVQYQFVLPKNNSFDGLRKILRRIEKSGQGSFLAVLKLFGKQNPNAAMSFPMEGYTLALDFKVNEKVFALLNDLDEIIERYGGRIYLAKDARMNAAFFHKSYAETVESEHFQSSQSKRLSASNIR